MSNAKMSRRRPGEHGALPLSKRTRQRMLADLMRRADGGDTNAAATLVLLSFEVEQLQRDEKFVAALNAAVAP